MRTGAIIWLAVTVMIAFANIHAYAQQLQVVGRDGFGNLICNGPRGPGPCALIQQWMAQNPGANVLTMPQPNILPMPPGTGVGVPVPGPQGAPNFRVPVPQAGIPSLPQQGVSGFGRPLNGNPQDVAIQCAQRSGTDVNVFADCAGKNVILPQREQAVMDCAFDTTSKVDFAACAAPNLGIHLSRDQQTVANCAMQSNGDEGKFASCAGSRLVGDNLTPDQQAVIGCAAEAGDASDFASCSASSLIGNHASREQQVAIECAVQSEGDPTQFAGCAGTKMLNLPLNPEQQIAVQCIVSTGAQPYAAGACIATGLTTRELEKCAANGFGGDDGCFGNNNDLVGRNSWTARTLAQVAGGPNSVVRNPGQIFGGPNSVFNNPGQILGGPNSVFNNPGQIAGGPNSVINNPGQILGGPNSVFHNPSQLAPPPVNLGTVGGHRVCLPWC